MTETVTIETVQATEQMLETYLKGLTDTLEVERADRQDQRRNIRDTAIQYGNNHSIEDDLDRLLVAIGLDPRPAKARFYLKLRYEQVIPSTHDLRTNAPAYPNEAPAAACTGGYTATLSWEGSVSAQIEIPGTSRLDDDQCRCDHLATLDVHDMLTRARNEYGSTYVPYRNAETGKYVGSRSGADYQIVGAELSRCGWYYCPRNNPEQPEQRKDPVTLTMS